MPTASATVTADNPPIHTRLSSPIRWGMIGVGSVAEHKSGPAFLRAPGGTLAAVAARRPAAAADFARRHGIPRVFDSPAELMTSADIDAVYIATPPSSHAQFALAVAAAGKPCCVEKPMAVRHADSAAMARAFDAAGVPLFVSYYRRSLPRFRQVAMWLNAGRIGPPLEVSWVLQRTAAPSSATPNWRLDPAEAPGGLFEDLACHGLDLFDMLFGPIDEITQSQVTLPLSQHVVPDRVEADWRHAGSVAGAGRWDFAADARRDEVVIRGDAGEIRFSIFDEAPLELREHSGRVTRESITHPVPIQLPHVEALNTALLDGRPHPSTGASALRTAWATERILHGSVDD